MRNSHATLPEQISTKAEVSALATHALNHIVNSVNSTNGVFILLDPLPGIFLATLPFHFENSIESKHRERRQIRLFGHASFSIQTQGALLYRILWRALRINSGPIVSQQSPRPWNGRLPVIANPTAFVDRRCILSPGDSAQKSIHERIGLIGIDTIKHNIDAGLALDALRQEDKFYAIELDDRTCIRPRYRASNTDR